MAYSGTTAASTVANPPQCIYRGAGSGSVLGTSRLTAWSSGVTRAGGYNVWMYNSTNLTTDMTVAGFFSDGYRLGMQVGDIVMGTQYTSAGSSFITFQGVVTTTNSTAGYNLTTLGMITSTRASSL